MLRFLLCMFCLLAAASAQQLFYCNDAGPIIRDKEFYLTTRRSGESSYPPGLTCEFNAESSSGYYFVEIQQLQVSTAVLTISSGGSTLFSGSVHQRFESTLATATRSLKVRFDATRDSSHGIGATILVREFQTNGCPPEWMYYNGHCYGTSRLTFKLNFTDAQKACNKMRSNLLQRPQFIDPVGPFIRSLSPHIRTYFSWIGLTDRTSAGRFVHYWLNGERHYTRSEISCVNSGGSYSSCHSTQRCGTMRSGSIYVIYMDRCSDINDFACSMPQRGTAVFYRVPVLDDSPIDISTRVISWIWIAVGIVVGLGVLCGIVFAGVRHNSAPRRAVGPASVVVSTGAVTIPVQPQPPPYQNLPPPPVYSRPPSYKPY